MPTKMFASSMIILASFFLTLPFSEAKKTMGGPRKAKDSKMPLHFCAPPETLLEKIEDCESNDLFIEEGEKCLDRLDEAARKASDELKKRFQKTEEQKQDAKFIHKSHDDQKTIESFEYVIALNQLAITEIQKYKDNLAFPPDWDEEDVNEGDVKKYIKSVDCYGTNQDNLDSLLADFHSRLVEFQKAKALSEQHFKTVDGRKDKMEIGDKGTEIVTGIETIDQKVEKQDRNRKGTITGDMDDSLPPINNK